MIFDEFSHITEQICLNETVEQGLISGIFEENMQEFAKFGKVDIVVTFLHALDHENMECGIVHFVDSFISCFLIDQYHVEHDL